MRYIGVDPGGSGAAVIINREGQILDEIRFTAATPHDIADWFREWTEDEDAQAILEKVHAMPKQGVSSTFKFGQSFGFLEGCLTSLEIPFDYVTPQKWQKAMQCMTKGDKNISKARAQRMYPNHKSIVHANADALLIANYCKQISK